MNPLLSVIVPFHAVAEYLAACLDSLQAQVLTDFEVILVDDGSPDASAEIAAAYCARDPRFRLLTRPNQGPGPARNDGIAEARGTYLAFVDSDDLVPPRAFAHLVGLLEETGSDIAAGNAWRFSEKKGSYPSWTHRQAFANDVTGTHINSYPLLVRDRMLWNKVYRRSFWLEHGYTFPAIRYEDWPIVLAAHLDAARVEVSSEYVYMWRDRGTQNSITQRTYDADNAHDRIVSANMILDDLEQRGANREVIAAVEGYLVDVDLVALAGALANASDTEWPELGDATVKLASRMEAPDLSVATRLARLIYRRLRIGDAETARAFGQWRADGDRAALLRYLSRRPNPGLLVAVLRAIAPRRRPQNPLKPRRLRNRLVSAGIEGSDVVLVINAKLRRRFAKDATVSLRLRGVRGPVGRTEVTLTDTGMCITAILPAALFGPEPRELRLRVTNGVLRWASPVRVKDPDLLPPLLPLGGDTWGAVAHIPGTPSGLSLAALTSPIVGHASLVGDEMHLALPGRSGSITVTLPSPSPDVVVPLVDGVARFTWEHFDNDVSDNPYSGRAWRRLFLTEAMDPEDPCAGRILLATKTGILRRGNDTIALGTSHSGWCHLVVDRHLDEADRQAREAKL